MVSSTLIQKFKNPFRTLIEVRTKTRELMAAVGWDIRLPVLIHQGLSMFGAVVELLSLVSIVPFLGLLANPELFAGKAWMIKIGDVLGAPDSSTLTIYLGLISLCALTLRHISFYLLDLGRARLRATILAILFEKVIYYYMHVGYAMHMNMHSSVSGSRLLGRLGTIYDNMLAPPVRMIMSMLFFVLGFSTLMWQDAPLAIVAILAIVFSFAVYSWLTGERLQRRRLQAREIQIKFGKELDDTLRAIEDVKAQCRELEYASYLTAFKKRAQRVDLQLNALPLLLAPILEITVYTALIVIILYYVAQGAATANITSLALFGLLAYRSLPYVRNLLSDYESLKNGVIFYDEIRDNLLAAIDYVPPKNNPPPLVNWRRLECKGMNYSYEGATKLSLKDVNLCIERGSSVGFCGVSGSGKTTLIKLILGLLSPTKGDLLVDGKSTLKDARYLRKWQQTIAYVPQHIATLSISIAQNVVMSFRPENVDRERVMWALSCAQLKEYLQDTQDGIDTIMAQDGRNMSIGQRQRLAIARSMYSGRNLMIWDEGTSSLDSNTEREVLKAIRDVLTDHTLIMVAHRLNTIRFCDTIYVMRDAGIVDHGTYDELYERSEYFRKLTGEAPD
jgi:HlyD family secretion protein